MTALATPVGSAAPATTPATADRATAPRAAAGGAPAPRAPAGGTNGVSLAIKPVAISNALSALPARTFAVITAHLSSSVLVFRKPARSVSVSLVRKFAMSAFAARTASFADIISASHLLGCAARNVMIKAISSGVSSTNLERGRDIELKR